MVKGKKVGVVLPAGGQSRRMGPGLPKQFQDIGGRKLYTWSLETFTRCEEVDEIVLVLPADSVERETGQLERRTGLSVVAGGETRWQSVQNGFGALSDEVEVILVHDAARPFVPLSIIRECIDLAARGKTAIPGLPQGDTLKEVEGDQVVRTLDRSKLVRTQTPQGFSRPVLEKIYSRMNAGSIPPELLNDEAGIAESLGEPVTWFEGSEENRKITRAEDLDWAVWMSSRSRQETGTDV